MKRSETLDPRIRPLTAAEPERLRGHARELVTYRQTVRRGTWIALSVVVLVLWIITLLASDTSAVWATLAWLAIGAVLAPAHEWIEKRGEAMPPARVIPADAKWELADGIPEHLGVVRAEFERLEEVLAARA